MKASAAGLLSAAVGPIMLGPTPTRAAQREAGRVLVACFSRTGTTREVAGQIQGLVGGDLFEIRTVVPYPADYRATTDQAKREQEENRRPALAGSPAALEACDTVFLGYPNWWGTLPMALFTFLENRRLDGKTIIPFCTHEGSGLGRSLSDLRRLCPKSAVLGGLALRGGGIERVRADSARRDVARWLRDLKLAA